MSKVLDNKYEIGDTVYLKTDPEQQQRIVFAFKVTLSETLYELAFGTITSVHYDFELSATKNTLVNCGV